MPVVKQLDATGKPVGGVFIDCLELATGQPRWAVASAGYSLWNAVTPVVAENTLFAFDSQGNTAFRLGDALPQLSWFTPKDVGVTASPHFGPTPAVTNGFIYSPLGWPNTKLLCQRFATGEVVGMLEIAKGSQAMLFASPTAVDGKIIYCNVVKSATAPNLYLLHGGPDFHVIAQCTIPHLMEYPSPTVADGKLYLRLEDGVACYDLRKQGD